MIQIYRCCIQCLKALTGTLFSFPQLTNARQVIALVYSEHKKKLEPTIDALLVMASDMPSPAQPRTVQTEDVLATNEVTDQEVDDEALARALQEREMVCFLFVF